MWYLLGAYNKHFVFIENFILDYRNRETVLFTQYRSKIYPRYSTLISFFMMSINTDKFDAFKANKITGSSNSFKTKKSVINFTFQRPSTELVMTSIKWRPNMPLKQNYYIFIFFFKNVSAPGNFTCCNNCIKIIICLTKYSSYINMFSKCNFPI